MTPEQKQKLNKSLSDVIEAWMRYRKTEKGRWEPHNFVYGKQPDLQKETKAYNPPHEAKHS